MHQERLIGAAYADARRSLYFCGAEINDVGFDNIFRLHTVRARGMSLPQKPVPPPRKRRETIYWWRRSGGCTDGVCHIPRIARKAGRPKGINTKSVRC